MSSSDLQALFLTLKPRASQDRKSASPAPGTSSHPASSNFHTDPRVPSTPPPAVANNVANSATHGNQAHQTQSSTSNTTATAQNLLNLLNFGNTQNGALNRTNVLPGASDSTRQHTATQSISASDLVARIMSPPAAGAVSPGFPGQAEAKNTTPQQTTSASRNALLELLNKQASTHADSAEPSISVQDEFGQDNDLPSQEESDLARELRDQQEEFQNGEPKTIVQSIEKKPIFTYTNPFEALNASRSQTPQTAASRPEDPGFDFSPTVATVGTPTNISARKKLTPKPRVLRSGNSPQPENDLIAHDATQLPTPLPNPALSLRQKQPKVETPGTAMAQEVSESVMQNVLNETPAPPRPAKGIDGEDGAEGQEGSGEWEDEEDLPEGPIAIRTVPVYNFPIKAFVSITLNLMGPSKVRIREGSVMEISRLKKEFDQLDRSLAAATSKYITYAFPKHGGLRIIRQDDGCDRHVFKHTHDRIFNVAVCTSVSTGLPNQTQAVLGTGLSGAVYYATVFKEGNDLFEKNQLESESLVFAPWPHTDENTAGGVLKTRAKRSSRHPEFFAIGRGKSIHIIWPATAISPRYGINEENRKVDVEKFYQDRALQIQTGKAGKDFIFSEDDTMIVSLDKTGRLRFWDIRKLVEEEYATALRVAPQTIDTPALSLSTVSPTEKSWPTSVLFVDKSRPYSKGGALRYVLVGLRQNHTLQLWDIALGKAVQEINFPHANETDGICSVTYHPSSGIIAVGHPTRNSIFFIHLSAPRYTLSSQLSQAAFVSKVASKDPELPKPESTACMSGIREISFAEKGELRSVELLSVQKAGESGKTADSIKNTDEQATLFELYIVHSKGVTCLAINKEDLGWNADNKVVHSIDAQKEGLVSVKELALGSVIEEPARSNSPAKEQQQQPVKASKKKAKKATQTIEEPATELEALQQAMPVPEQAQLPVTELPAQELAPVKDSKKSKKKTLAAEQTSTSTEARAVSPVKPTPLSQILSRPSSDVIQANNQPQSGEAFSAKLMEQELQKVEKAVSGEFKKELAALYQNISSDRATQDQTSLTRQEAILRLVSSTLSTNVEKSLSGIITDQIQKAVLPGLVKTVSEQLTEALPQRLDQTVSRELDSKLPKIVSSALQGPEISQAISQAVTQKVSQVIELQLKALVVKTITPMFQDIARSAAEQAAVSVQAQLGAQLQVVQVEQSADRDNIDKFSQILQGMAETLQAMSDSQVAFQGQILRERQQAALASASGTISTSRQISTTHGAASPASVARPTPIKPRSKEEIEFEEISSMMSAGNYEEGTIKWLQSSQPARLFDEVFVRFTPEYLATDVSPLVAFSVAVTIANSMDTNVERRLEWISSAFDAVDPLDAELTDLSHHAPALISSIIQKLESLYMTLAESEEGHPVLKTIPLLAKKAREMKAMFAAKEAATLHYH